MTRVENGHFHVPVLSLVQPVRFRICPVCKADARVHLGGDGQGYAVCASDLCESTYPEHLLETPPTPAFADLVRQRMDYLQATVPTTR
jgi:hypothetical protein